MPPAPIIDYSGIDLDRVIVTREEIYEQLPHRYEFMLLDGIVHVDSEAYETVAVREVRADEFWVRGHIPGRPIFPGVLMLETAAHLASYVTVKFLLDLDGRFLGLGGVDNAKFRAPVVPGDRLVLTCKMVKAKSRQVIYATQAWCDDRMVFEAQISGVPL